MIKEKNEARKALGNVGWRGEGHNFKVVRDSLTEKVLSEQSPGGGNDTEVALWVK